MKFLDLFAGIGGFRLGMESVGHECVGFCEIDKFARASYKAIHNTEGEIELHDITTVTDELIRGIGHVDIICGGFPCQAFSIAGKRKGFEDTRGTLFFEIARFASILRPRLLFLENVKGLLNHNGGDTFETILSALDELGYDAEWQVLNSKNFGVPQNRERVFIIGHLRGRSIRTIFPLGGNDKTTDCEQQKIKKVGNIRKKGKSQSGDVVSIDSLAPTLCSTTTQKDPLKVAIPGGLAPTLSTMQGRGQEPKIIQKARGFNKGAQHSIAPTLSSNSWQENNLVKVVDFYNKITKDEVGTLTSSGGGSTVRAGSFGITDGYRIRKLTPRECWRLQGFPDWAFDKAQEVNSNSQLYKQAGNSVTVNVIAAIVKELK